MCEGVPGAPDGTRGATGTWTVWGESGPHRYGRGVRAGAQSIECGPSSNTRLDGAWGISHQQGSGNKVRRKVGGDVGGGDEVLARGVGFCVGRSKLAFRCGVSISTVEPLRRGVVPVGDEHSRRICKLSSAGSNHRRAAVLAHVVVDDQNAVREPFLCNGARSGGPFAGTGCGHHPQGGDVIVSRGKVGRRVFVLYSSEGRRLVHLQPSRDVREN